MKPYGSKRASRPFHQIHGAHRCAECAECNIVKTKARRSVERRAVKKAVTEAAPDAC